MGIRKDMGWQAMQHMETKKAKRASGKIDIVGSQLGLQEGVLHVIFPMEEEDGVAWGVQNTFGGVVIDEDHVERVGLPTCGNVVQGGNGDPKLEFLRF